MSVAAWLGSVLLAMVVGALACIAGVWLVRFRTIEYNGLWLTALGAVTVILAPLVGVITWLAGGVSPEVVALFGTRVGWLGELCLVLMVAMFALLVAMAVQLLPALRHSEGPFRLRYYMFPWRQLARRRWRKEHDAQQAAISA